METNLRNAFFLLLLLSAASASASGFGYSRVTLHRTWEITSGAPFDFTGALAVNDSSQRVVSVTTTPGMERSVDENGTIVLHYSGNGTITLEANAIVDINYDPRIPSDPAVPGNPLQGTGLTEADAGISHQARELSHPDSALLTIRDLVNWVHGYVAYDINYWGKSKSAMEVYREKRGVCVEYTHLLISLARSLGFQTRYVSGYVHTGSWQPHAWAEIYLPGHGWLAADATFAQAGVLDSTHLAIRKSDDQSASYDLLISEDENVDIRAQDSLETAFGSNDAKGVSVNLSVDSRTLVAEVTINNSRPAYALGSHTFSVPEAYGGEEASVMLLRPNETIRLYRGFNRSLFQDGFLYTIPVSASFNDASDSENLTADLFLPGSGPGGGGASPPGGCAASYVILGSLAAAVLAAGCALRLRNPAESAG
ncbi:transglutaminase-like domain-containing protein [Candidatus Micrarchaeota archaeon]|nr:transglutaminase-like domain-containing protein [Candidatus Micrarchaeota archaeon]